MILEAIKKWNISTKKSYFIGDKLSDRIAAKKTNIKFFYKDKQPFNKQIIKII